MIREIPTTVAARVDRYEALVKAEMCVMERVGLFRVEGAMGSISGLVLLLSVYFHIRRERTEIMEALI